MDGQTNFRNKRTGKNSVLLSTPHYKNLGSKQVISGSLLPEITVRMGKMRGGFKKVRRKVLRNNNIDIGKKKIVVKGRLLTKGLFHAGTSAGINRSEAKNVHGSVMAVYRGVKGADSPIAAKVSDQQLMNEMEILSPLSLVAFERIMFFVRVIRKLQGPLLLVLCVAYLSRRSWLKDVGYFE